MVGYVSVVKLCALTCRMSIDQDIKPRALRFTWNMKTTSSLDPNIIMKRIRDALDANGCDYEQRERYLLLCEQGEGEDALQFEMEVCRLPRLALHGVRYKRISGNSLSYKTIASKLSNDLMV